MCSSDLKDKIDHPRKGSKDLSDAVCGSIYNSISLTPPDLDKQLEIHTYAGAFADELQQLKEESDRRLKGVIRMPEKRTMPDELAEYIDQEEKELERVNIDGFRIL